MSRGVRRIAFVVAALGATVACSLTTDLNGLASDDGGAGGGADGATDAAPGDAPADVVLDAPAAFDAAPPPCTAQTVIDTPLTSTLGGWVPRAFTQPGGYPKVEAFFGTSAAVLIPFVDTTPVPIDAGDPDAGPTFFNPPERKNSVSSLWQNKPLALRSFDVSLEFFVRCTSSSSCADGLAFAWLDTAAIGPLDTTNAGNVMGLPPGVAGGAVLVDDYKNDVNQTSDPAVPALEIVKLDATKVLNTYPWVVSSRSTPFLAAWHKLAISVRGDSVTVTYDGGPPLSGTVPSLASGLVVLTAGTGGETDAVAVRNVKGSFYDCMP